MKTASTVQTVIFQTISRYKSILLIILAASLMSLSLHPLPFHFLAWFGLVPLLYATENKSAGSSFWSGIVFGSFFALFTLFWIVFLQIEINIKLLIVFGLILLFLYVGLYFGAALLLGQRIGFWSLPFTITGLEYIRGLGELGFPWLSFGYSQARYPLIIQQAAIYGVYGISFWLVLLNVSIFYALKRRNLKNILLALLIIMLPLIYGITRTTHHQARLITVGIVQPNIDPNLKFSREMRYKTFERLMYESARCARIAQQEYGSDPDLIVWPETATPVFLKSPGAYRDLVTHLVDRLAVPIFTGTAIYESENNEIFNGAVLVEPDLGIRQEYRKIHLVPFGEHIPFDRHIALFRKVDFGEGDYSPGSTYTVFETKKFKFACLICFESIFPELSRRFVNNGAEVLINITNDGWFGKISGPQQHNDMAILRSVENGVVLLRSANTGTSMVVDQLGNVVMQTPLFVEDVIVSSMYMDPIRTPYRTIGYCFPVICLVFMTILLLYSFATVLRRLDR